MFERERTGQHVRGAGVDTRVVDMRVGVDKGVGRAHKQVGNAIAGHVHAAVQAGAQCCGITRGSEHPHALVGGQVDVRIGCRGVAEEQVHGSVVVVGGLFTDSCENLRLLLLSLHWTDCTHGVSSTGPDGPYLLQALRLKATGHTAAARAVLQHPVVLRNCTTLGGPNIARHVLLYHWAQHGQEQNEF
jgi:hypothetical protein